MIKHVLRDIYSLSTVMFILLVSIYNVRLALGVAILLTGFSSAIENEKRIIEFEERRRKDACFTGYKDLYSQLTRY